MTIHDYTFETGMYRPPAKEGVLPFSSALPATAPGTNVRSAPCTKRKSSSCGASRRSRPTSMPWRPWQVTWQRNRFASVKTVGSNGEVIRALFGRVPGLIEHQGAHMLIEWLLSGGRTAFLQDGNSLIMPPGDLIQALTYLKAKLPSITRITTYARARTLAQRSLEDLQAVRATGLDRLHLGLESGDDELLRQVRKGVDADGLISGGRKAMAAGFQVSEYVDAGPGR